MYFSKKSQLRNNKYRNVKQTYKGFSYDSKLEARKAFELDCLVKAGEIKTWTRQDRIALKGENGTIVCYYKPDFTVYHKDGTIEIIEMKSIATKTPLWRLKWKLLEDQVKNQTDIKLTVETG